MPKQPKQPPPIHIDYSLMSKPPTAGGALWWLAEDDETLQEEIWAVAEQLRKNLSFRQRQNYFFHLMYSDTDSPAYRHYMGSPSGDGAELGGRITLNVVQNCVDSAASMIARNRPKPMFLTDDGDSQAYLKAQQLTKYVSGVMDDCNVYQIAEQVFTDCAVYGTGALKVCTYSDRVCVERVYIGELLMDELEGEHPRQIHQRRYWTREVLAARFPDKREEIRLAQSDIKGIDASRHVADLVPVLESWHLKSGPDEKDGRYVISVGGAVLLDEAYDKDSFPILIFRWYNNNGSFFGRGIAQQLARLQRSINKILRTIEEVQRLYASPTLMVPNSAGLNEDELRSNQIGQIIHYSGESGPPSFVPPVDVNPALYSHLWQLEAKAYATIGLSQNLAQGSKPPDLESAVALREQTDISTGRFMVISQRWEDWFTSIAKWIVDISKELYEKDPQLSVRARTGDALREIRWSDVDMDRDRFKISVFEVSALPQTPAGRIDFATQLAQTGLQVPPEMMVELLQIPDVKRFTVLETSTVDLTQKVIGKIKETGLYRPEDKPIAEMNLPLALKIAAMEKVRALVQEFPDDVLSQIDLYIQDLNQLNQQQQPAPPPPPQGGPPGGAPPQQQ